jgi:hypothetical protein
MAEDAARELPTLSLVDALELVHLYPERGSPKYENAALRWLERTRFAAMDDEALVQCSECKTRGR